jgi:hypothetical protein
MVKMRVQAVFGSNSSYTAIGSAALAACQEIDLLTNDRIQSTAAGWGALPVACYVVANSIAESVQDAESVARPVRRRGLRISNNDARKTPVEGILEEAIKGALRLGVEKSDAALIAAATLYFCGVNVRSGIAAGAKSLGRMARVIAGAEHGGVALLCTPWSTCRLTAFSAVQAIHGAMRAGKLTSVDGRRLPVGVGGAPVVADSVLGEDIIGPEVAANGARLGTQAMLEAFAGAGLPPNKLMAALLGTAAVLEVVHTDAMVGDEHGLYGSVSPIHIAGRSAANAAGLPDEFHLRGTHERVETGKLIGELALMLRECGSPSAIGMLALQEMLSIFQEGLENGAGFSSGPVAASLGFLNAYAILGLKYLQHFGWDAEKAADLLQQQLRTSFIDPEYASLGYNTVARMAEGLYPGPASRLTLLVTEGAKVHAINRRVRVAIDRTSAGATIEEVAADFDRERLAGVEERCSLMFSKMTGKAVEIRITRLARAARRSSPMPKAHLSLDCDADVEVTIDGKVYVFSGLLHKAAPEIVLGNDEEWLSILPFASIPIDELILTPHTVINVTIPAVVGALLKDLSPAEAAQAAEAGAWISSGTPGARSKAIKAIHSALRYVQVMSVPEVAMAEMKTA